MEQRIGFRPVLEGELFGPLQNPNMFDAVSLDMEVGTVTWPNGAPNERAAQGVLRDSYSAGRQRSAP
jgi:hypothetical protein